MRLVLACGTFGLIYDREQESLHLHLEEKTAKKNASLEVASCELFGFGSGEYAEGPEAGDIMSDVAGRWLNFKLASGSESFIAEADKRLADHIRSSDLFGKVSWSLNWFLVFSLGVYFLPVSMVCCFSHFRILFLTSYLFIVGHHLQRDAGCIAKHGGDKSEGLHPHC